MKKLISLVWNNYESDDRVKKKIETLSKYYDCIVYSVPKPKDYKQSFKVINPNITIKYIKTKNMIDWVFKRLISNELFWIKNINKKDLINISIVDCNDPDTLSAGRYIKSKSTNPIKVIYDAHEYHKDNFVPYQGLLGYYSKVASKLHYYREKKYINIIDRMIVVSNGIKKLIVKDKLTSTPIYVIPNYSKKYYTPRLITKDRIATFVGGHSRPGLEKIIILLQDLDYKIKHIGNPPKSRLKGVEYLGHMPKSSFMKHLEASELGLLFYDALNLSFENSMPNKLSDYVQANNIIITNNKLKEITKIVTKYRIGFALPSDSLEDKRDYFKRLVLHNIKNLKKTNLNKKFSIAKSDLSWEVNEPKLKECYK